MTAQPPKRLTETYLELRDGGAVGTIAVTPDFWPDLQSGKRTLHGRLVMAFAMTEDMSHWEVHPAGEEILLLLSGKMTVVLEGDPDEAFALQPGEAFVVPRGRWHRLTVTEPGELVFMTEGDGTEHKPL
ncbi:MAG: cupin domain-containing protein [Kiloniellaceae bacterium]